jgi:hypothetical protein
MHMVDSLGLMAPVNAYHPEKDRFSHSLTVAELKKALNDPRIDEDMCVGLTANYPGLAISSSDEAKWYLGFIDLFDGWVTMHTTQGEDDGKNPFKGHGGGFAVIDMRNNGLR